MTDQRGETRKRSLTAKILWYFAAFVAISFFLVYFQQLRAAREQVHSLLKADLQQVLEGISEGIDAEMLIDLAENGEPNEAGFSDDPRYIELIDFLDQIHQVEPDAWPYLYILGESPNEIFFVVDLYASHNQNKAAGFLEPYESNSGFILIGLDRQVYREVDAQFILMFRKWSEDSGILWLYHFADWLADLGIFSKQEIGIYGDEFGRWVSGYMPIENDAGEKVAAVGVDFEADLVEVEYQRYRLRMLEVMLLSAILPVSMLAFLIARVIRPIKDLNQIAERIHEDDQSEQSTFRNFRKVHGYDEIDALADMLQDMVEKLRQRERRFHAVIDAQDAMIVRTSPDGKFTFTNQTYDEFRGDSKPENLTNLSEEDYHPDDRMQTVNFAAEVNRSLTAEAPTRKHVVRIKDQEGNFRWYQWTITGIFNSQGELIEAQSVGQDITELKVIQRDLEQANTRLREISHELINATEHERTKIAREVHDDMLNYISELVMDLEGDIPAEMVNQTYQMIADRLRETVYDLRPPMLAYGLNYGLKDYVHTLSERLEGIAEVHFYLKESEANYPKEVDIHLFRIVQQACENVVEHAKSEKINISADLQPDAIHLVVEDDGLGFDWESEDFIDLSVGQNRFGLAGMFERGLIVGALVNIYSEEGEGTRIEVTWREEDYPLG